MKISAVCMTTYPKRAAMLDQALSSFFMQNFDPAECEIVVVNDGAPLQSLNPRCRVVNIQPGLTLGAKRNVGSAHARGWALATWDDDDISLPNRLADQFALLQQGAVYCRASSMWAADAQMRIKGLLLAPAYASNMVVHSVLDAVGGYPAINYREDMELMVRLAVRGLRMQAMPADKPFYVYRRHDSNASTAAGETAERQNAVDAEFPGRAEAQRVVDRILADSTRYVQAAVIPRIIHQVWIGPKPAPAGLMETWKRLNPTFRYELWDNARAARTTFRNAGQIVAQREWCGKADLMRYEILADNGGIYVDADSECVRSLPDEMLQNDSFACFENEIARPGLVANGYLGASVGNRLMKLCADRCAATNMNAGPAWVTTGPAMLTHVINDAQYADIRVYPSHFFIPKHYSGLEYTGTGPVFAKQHWGSTRNSYDSLAKL